MCFHLLMISVYIYIKNGSTCQEAAILCDHLSTVAQNVDVIRIS